MTSSVSLFAEREKKQLFLKEEVMDKGFDTDWFADFISNKKGNFSSPFVENGTDVDVWEFDELCEIVL